MAGPLLSTVNVTLVAVGAGLPAVSVAVPAAREIPSGPSPVMFESVTVRVVPVPVTAIVAVIVSAPPDRAALGEYVRAAVGAVLSTVMVAPLVGAAVTTLPARSVPMLIVTVAVPLPPCTV